MEQDIRWEQRFQSFSEALKQLKAAVTEVSNPSNLEKEGTIQRFEFTHELAWRVMKDYLEFEGFTNLTGSRSPIRQAFNSGLISNGQVWMDMIESRNRTVHAYQQDILEREYEAITKKYFPQIEAFQKKMQEYL